MKKYLPVLLLVILIVPSVALASWWNPFTWKIFKKSPEVKFEQTITPIATDVSTELKKEESPKISETDKKIKTETIVKKEVVINDPLPVEKNTELDRESSKDAEYQRLLSISKNKVLENSPGYNIMQDFLKNQTIENLRNFCNLAKEIEGKTTEKVLGENKEEMITVKKSLSEEIYSCVILNDNKYQILSLDNNLLINFQNDDTNTVREAKILYNDKIKGLINTSKIKFIGFRKVTVTKFNQLEKIYTSPVEYFQFEIDNNKELINKSVGDETYYKIYIRSSDSKLKSFSDRILDLSKDFN